MCQIFGVLCALVLFGSLGLWSTRHNKKLIAIPGDDEFIRVSTDLHLARHSLLKKKCLLASNHEENLENLETIFSDQEILTKCLDTKNNKISPTLPETIHQMFRQKKEVTIALFIGNTNSDVCEALNRSEIYCETFSNQADLPEDRKLPSIFFMDFGLPAYIAPYDWVVVAEGAGSSVTPAQLDTFFLNIGNHAKIGVVIDWSIPDYSYPLNYVTITEVKRRMYENGFSFSEDNLNKGILVFNRRSPLTRKICQYQEAGA